MTGSKTHLGMAVLWLGVFVSLVWACRVWPKRPAPAVQKRPVAAPSANESLPVRTGGTQPAHPAHSVRSALPFWPQQAGGLQLHTRSLVFSCVGDDGVSADERTVWIAQFGGPLGPDERAALAHAGIDVLLPAANMAFHVRASQRALHQAKAAAQPALLGWAHLLPEDRLLPPVRAFDNAQPGVRHLELYPGADRAALAQALRGAGAEILAQKNGGIDVRGPQTRAFALKLAAIDGVYAVDLARPAIVSCNVQAAGASQITACQSAPFNLTGSGITIMLRDDGAVFSHPDLSGRVQLAADTAALSTTTQHATHVAGTLGGTGSLSAAARGMAPGCQIVSYDYNGDDVAEPRAAHTAYGARLSNHSYGFATGWTGGTFIDNQSTFGQYSAFARNWDALVRSDGLLMIKAAGNDRDNTGAGHPHDGQLGADGDYYTTVDSSSTSKNILTVGAAADGAQATVPTPALVLLPSSSSGPCLDGRLRPELIANGDALLSCNNSASAGSECTALSGASMACAVVTGASALFLERYQQRYGAGACCAPEYLRALFAQTAADMGRTGPDYLHGFGLLNLQAAAALFDADNGTGKRLLTRTLSAAAPERFFALTSDGVQPVKATLCWTDEAGDLLSARALVNDLDLRLIRASDQAVFYPYTLNPGAPEQPAASGVNTADTIEQLVLNAPAAGTYFLAVKGTALATATSFALASSHDLAENLPPSALANLSPLKGSPPLLVTCSAEGSSDPDGSIVSYHWDFGDGTAAGGSTVQHTYQKGSYIARLTVTDNGGLQTSATAAVGVSNEPPVAVMSLSPESGPVPQTVYISALGSSDSDGTLVDYAWDLGDGASAHGATLTHTYGVPGIYYISLLVTDNGGETAAASGAVVVGNTISGCTGSFTLNFTRSAADRFSLSTKSLPVDPSFVPAGQTGSVCVGSKAYPFTLDEKGRSRLTELTLNINLLKGSLRVTLSKTALNEVCGAFGAINRDLKDTPVRLPFALVFTDGRVYGSPALPFVYNAKLNRSGRGKLKQP